MARRSKVIVKPVAELDENIELDKGFLTSNQLLFVDKLLADQDFNPTEAARLAGYSNPPQAANKLMRNDTIRKLLGKRIYERGVAAGVDAARVFRELSLLGLFNPKSAIDPKTREPMHLADMPDEVAACVKEFKVHRTVYDDGTVDITYEYKFWDKLEALAMLARHLGLLKELAPVNVNVNQWNVIMEALAKPPAEDPLDAKMRELRARAEAVVVDGVAVPAVEKNGKAG